MGSLSLLQRAGRNYPPFSAQIPSLSCPPQILPTVKDPSLLINKIFSSIFPLFLAFSSSVFSWKKTLPAELSMDLIEGVGESSSPPRSFGSYSNYDVRNDVYNRLVESGNEDAVSNPEFREQLDAHFNRLPAR